MNKLDMLNEGKAKKVYKTDVEDAYIVDYKDDAIAFYGIKKGTIIGKGVVNNKMSNHIFHSMGLFSLLWAAFYSYIQFTQPFRHSSRQYL